MKLVLKSLALFTLLIAAAFGQTQLASAGGGILTSKATVLTLPAATITAQVVGGVVTTGNLGTVSLVTPALSSGTLEAGGTLDAGGAGSISVPGIPLTYLPAFVAGGTWQRLTLANGTHYYVLSANLVDDNGVMGAIVLTTSNVGTGNFSAPVTVASIDLVVDGTPDAERQRKRK
jgi:hypothetical protein